MLTIGCKLIFIFAPHRLVTMVAHLSFTNSEVFSSFVIAIQFNSPSHTSSQYLISDAFN